MTADPGTLTAERADTAVTAIGASVLAVAGNLPS
jgi:hypothetical protein